MLISIRKGCVGEAYYGSHGSRTREKLVENAKLFLMCYKDPRVHF